MKKIASKQCTVFSFFSRKNWQWTIVYQLLSDFFEKCEIKKGKSRYNHQTGFCRKMKQYKERTNDAIVIIFYQSTKVRTQIEDAVNVINCFYLLFWFIIGINIYNTYTESKWNSAADKYSFKASKKDGEG